MAPEIKCQIKSILVIVFIRNFTLIIDPKLLHSIVPATHDYLELQFPSLTVLHSYILH